MNLHTKTRRDVPNPPPYEDAAEKRTVTVWACAVCGHAWEDSPSFNAEHAARSCHTGQRQCSAFRVEADPAKPVVHAFLEEGGVEDETRAHCGQEIKPTDSCSDDVERITCHLCAPQNRIRCDSLTVPHRTLCEKHLAEANRAAWEKRPVAKWDGVAMIFSDALDEWYQDPDAAIEAAADRVLDARPRRADASDGNELPKDTTEPTSEELREELDAMRLIVGEPVHARPFELDDHVRDDLPSDEYGEGPDFTPCRAAVDALNAALEALPPLSWTTGKARLDLEWLVSP